VKKKHQENTERKEKGRLTKWERKGQSFENEQSKVQGDERKEKGRFTKWERKGQSFERNSSLRF